MGLAIVEDITLKVEPHPTFVVSTGSILIAIFYDLRLTQSSYRSTDEIARHHHPNLAKFSGDGDDYEW